MKFFSSLSKYAFVGISLFSLGVSEVGLLMPSLAFAQDDGQEPIWSGLADIVGFAIPKDDRDTPEDPVYRERPPLVVPPTTSLPSPQKAVQETDPHWIEDVDKAKHRQLIASDPKAAMLDYLQGKKPLSPTELVGNRAAAVPEPVKADHCGQWSDRAECLRPNWQELAGQKIVDYSQLPPALGQEPERRLLSDPPSGYRVVTKMVKMTPDKIKKKETLSAKEYLVQERKNSSSDDE